MSREWVPRDPHAGGEMRCPGVRNGCNGTVGTIRVRRASGDIEHLCIACAATVLGCPETALGGDADVGPEMGIKRRRR